ncbi:MAG: protein kinase [Simkaniaceae bacterium]|nr:protein kinase [Simkaniaceae bacterium]
MEKLGRYILEKLIATGGMGAIYLANDPICERKVAIKKIKPELRNHASIRDRFLREAKFASGLSHPSIIPVYSIHQDDEDLYYTMPYIEGETLKQIITETRKRDSRGESLHPIGGSIPALVRIFLHLCEAMDYAHSKGILHRDLKPENVIVGRFGEVLIIDWGLALRIGKKEVEIDLPSPPGELTRPGKVVGTVSFMAPERAFGHPSSIQTDIYSLGVSFYQLLTLRLPFQRRSLAEFRKQAKHELLIDPQEKAPYRDIPRKLSSIVSKCLAFHPDERYRSVHAIIDDLKSYIEGCPDWTLAASLNLNQHADWEFQENILLAKHIAITRMTEVMEWVMLMISKVAFSGNTRLEAEVSLGQDGDGLGFLLGVPEPDERKGLEDGYCLWIGKDHCTLFRQNVEVMDIPDVTLEQGKTYHLAIEMIDNHLKFYIDHLIKLDYSSHIPLVGGHVGLLYRNADFTLETLSIFVGSQNIMINCLSVPDAFFQSKDFSKALEEYRRIGNSFQGRIEGREAIFRAGMALLEWGKVDTKKRALLFDEALKEFEKLENTPGAPLEYLGKSLVYKASLDLTEEIKCLEYALRKYPKHPQLKLLEQHIIFRLHETAKRDRTAAFHYALLTLFHLPHMLTNRDTETLMKELVRHLEPLPFITPLDDPLNTMLQLSFWLAKPLTLYEVINLIPKNHPNYLLLAENGLRALLYLNCQELAEKLSLDMEISLPEKVPPHPIWQQLLAKDFEGAKQAFASCSKKELSKPGILHLLYGCFLYVTLGKGAALSHFYGITETPYPPTDTLLAHYLQGNINLKSTWFSSAFLWEKIQLYEQLILFYTLLENKGEVLAFESLLKQELSLPLNIAKNLL